MSDKFFQHFGFEGNPFVSTNADKEPRLAQYFVPPPYFPSVKGDPADPKSCVVLAPRGGGKTAQKVMLEDYSREWSRKPFLCITYDRFEAGDRFKLSQVSTEWHLRRIAQRILLAILVKIEEGHGSNLTDIERKTTYFAIRYYLSELQVVEADSCVASIKTFPDKAKDFFDKYGSNIVALAAAVATKWGFGDLDLKSGEQESKVSDARSMVERLSAIAKSFGYVSTYILVDRVDESTLVDGNSELTYRLIKPVITDLHLLETNDIAFKFFLWDQVTEALQADGAFRSDRIPIYELSWSQSELETMLQKRLEAYSGGRVSSLNELVDERTTINLHRLVCYLGNDSPRDVIRLVARIIDEHTRSDDKTTKLDRAAIARGIQKFSDERAGELYGRFIPDLRKVGMLAFTIGQLSSEVFRIGNQGARNKVQNWMRVGAVVKSGEIPNPPNRPLHAYSVADPRLAITVMTSQSPLETIKSAMHVCPSCEQVLVREDEEATCHKCSEVFTPDEKTNVLERCKLEPSG